MSWLSCLFSCCGASSEETSKTSPSDALTPTIQKSIKCLPVNICLLIAQLAIPNIHLEQFDATNTKRIEVLLKDLGKHWKNRLNPKSPLIADYNEVRPLVVRKLASYVLRTSPFYKDTNIVVATDTKGSLQGILIFNKADPKNWKVEFLISAPSNIKRRTKRCHGVGTALFNHVSAQAQDARETQTMHLVSFPSAIAFYQNAGFKVVKKVVKKGSHPSMEMHVK